MVKKIREFFKSDLAKAILISAFTYTLFFYQAFSPNLTIYSGKDSTNLHYPIRTYLYQTLRSGRFPFWTEKIFAGFPIYADLETGYLSPINLLATFLLGPVYSYKFLHLAFYFLGSLSFYFFLKRKRIGLLGFTAANLVYYFNFFMLFHQQHFNIVLTAYLLPALLLLADVFLEKRPLSGVLFLGAIVANILYFGHFQALILILTAQFLYFITHANGLKSLAKFYAIFIISLSVLALPAVYPAYKLFEVSERGAVGTKLWEGSFTPADSINATFPYLYGSKDNYFGVSVVDDHFKHEVYIYAGISALIFALLGHASIMEKRMRIFIYSLFGVFFALAFLKYVPILKDVPLPPISLFRYWGRSFLLPITALSLMVAYFFNYFEFSLTKVFALKRYLFVLPALIFIAVLTVVNANTPLKVELFKQLRANFVFDINFYVWAYILLATCALLVLQRSLKNRQVAKLLFIGLLFVDVFYFIHAIARESFVFTKNLTDLTVVAAGTAPPVVERVVVFDDNIAGNKGLYGKYWNIFGYSQYASSVYINAVKSVGFVKERAPELKSILLFDDMTKKVGALGVTKVYAGNKVITTGVTGLIQTKNGIRVVTKEAEEGRVHLELTSAETGQIQTFIRNYSGWRLLIDGIKTELSNKEDALFLSFAVTKGTHDVILFYEPIDFYNGFKLAGGLMLLEILVLFVFRKKLQ